MGTDTRLPESFDSPCVDAGQQVIDAVNHLGDEDGSVREAALDRLLQADADQWGCLRTAFFQLANVDAQRNALRVVESVGTNGWGATLVQAIDECAGDVAECAVRALHAVWQRAAEDKRALELRRCIDARLQRGQRLASPSRFKERLSLIDSQAFHDFALGSATKMLPQEQAGCVRADSPFDLQMYSDGSWRDDLLAGLGSNSTGHDEELMQA